MIRSSGVGPDDLVLEFGAGPGGLTALLARTGARVIAIEEDSRFAARLERRFARDECVRVVCDDARTVPLPRRNFSVVANIPYAISTALMRRLLSPQQTALTGADLIVEWGFAKRVTSPVPRDMEVAWWQTRFDISIARRVRPDCFVPPPSVDSAHLVVRRRSRSDPHVRRSGKRR